MTDAGGADRHSIERTEEDGTSHGSFGYYTKAPRSVRALVGFLLIVTLSVSGLIALGVWQLHRLAWKLDLIEQVEQRVHAIPVAAPEPSEWPSVTAAHDAYRHIQMHGVFLHDHETLVHATTVRGSGYWVITPFQTDEGFVVLVNRGFVPTERRDPSTRADSQTNGETVVTGLIRMTEPKGRFLRANNPGANRWYSCDIDAIATIQGLSHIAPYFVDADATSNPGNLPIGGLTVINFPNNHLIYALTWFGLALMLVCTTLVFLHAEYRLRFASGRLT